MTTRPIAAGDIATALGGPGTAGQLVGSNGTTPQWVAPASAVTNYPDNRLFLISCVATNIVPLTATYSNGTAGVGATLTATAPGALVLDGYTPHVGDNVLIGGDETQTPHNGVYVVTTVGDGSHPYVLTRHAHCNQPAHFVDLWVVTSDWGNTLWAQFFLQELVVNTVGSDNVYFDPRGAGADVRFNHLGHGLQVVSGGAGVFTLSVSGLTTADIGGFNAAVSAAAPVQSVAGRTGAVAFTSNDVTTALAYTPTYTRAGSTGIKRTGIMIPYYVYVANPYNDSAFSGLLTLIRTNQNVPVIIIINQPGGDGHGGPGPQDAAVAQTIRMLKAAGATVVGYVSTQNATRSPTLVRADILLWNSLYPTSTLDGIFFDELPYDPGVGNANITLYKSYYDYAHSNGYSLVIGNPGTQQTSPWYDAHVADIYVCFENTSWPSLATFSIVPPQYYSGATTDYPRESFAVLVYGQSWDGTSFTTLRPYFGWIYATDNPSPASLGSPWSALPTYLSTLFAAAAS
jgi:hypothetical protein